MQNCFRAFVLLIACALVVHAADNGKEIEALMRVHGEAVAKADKARELATEKSRDETIAKLVKLAGRAYAEKDRVGETNAWRNVLQLDRQHSKARRYFTDLGTLDQVEKELGESKVLESIDSRKLVGKWIVMFSNKDSGPIVIPKDGVVRRIEGENGAGKLTIEKGEVLLRIPAFVERYTIMGDRIFVEQWAPTKTFPGSAPHIFGYGVRTE